MVESSYHKILLGSLSQNFQENIGEEQMPLGGWVTAGRGAVMAMFMPPVRSLESHWFALYP